VRGLCRAVSREDKLAILSVRPNVTEEGALEAFCGSGLSARYLRATRGKLRRIAAAYVPHSLYRVEYDEGKARHTRFLAMDQVEGMLDLYEFPGMLRAGDLMRVVTRNWLAPALSEERSQGLLKERVLRMIFQHGFFKLRAPHLQMTRVEIQFHMPYWLGLYGEDGTLRCRVMDAVRRKVEGDKAATLFENWLAA
jgi:hypothetical protein